MSPSHPRPCPACRSEAGYRPLPAKGFWERRILARLGVKPYRCSACGCKLFRKRSPKGAVGSLRRGQPRPETLASFDSPSPEDDRDFEQVIREMAEAERRPGLSGNQNPRTRPRAQQENPAAPAALEDLKQREDALDGFVHTGTRGVKRRVITTELEDLEPGEGDS